MNHRTLLLGLLLCCAAPCPAPAQVSKARGYLEKLQSLTNEIVPDKEDSKLEATAKDISDVVGSLNSALADVGETLARVSGPSESERSAVFNSAQVVRKATEIVSQDAKNLIELIKGKSRWTPDDYKKELANRCQDVRLEMNNSAQRQWAALLTRIEETRRWLRESLSAALTLRDNAANPAEGLEQLEEQISSKLDSLDERFQSAFMSFWGCHTRRIEANRVENDAMKRWQAAIKAADGNQFTDKVKALANSWQTASEEKMAAARADYDANLAVDRASEDRRKVSGDLARVMQDIRSFIKEATSDTINKRWADFDQWTKLFERDMSR